MQTLLVLLAVIVVWLFVLPALRRSARWADRMIGAFLTMLRRLFHASLAALIALPMILNPEDIPRPWQPWSALDLNEAPTVVARWKLRAMVLDPKICRHAIAQTGAAMQSLPDKVQSDACHIRQRVRVNGLASAAMAPVETRCPIAARLYLWERHRLQPLAQQIFGSGVARIHHYSSFSCRQMRTSRGTSTRMSQHATANALDISGFTLADGTRIMLSDGWQGNTRQARFLREARDGLCDWFNVTLSPDYNALHADHFHIDMGPYLSCR